MNQQMLMLMLIKNELEKKGIEVTGSKQEGFAFLLQKNNEEVGRISQTGELFMTHEQYMISPYLKDLEQAISNVRDSVNIYFSSAIVDLEGYPLNSRKLAEMGKYILTGQLLDNQLLFTLWEKGELPTILKDYEDWHFAKMAFTEITGILNGELLFNESEAKILQSNLVAVKNMGLNEEGTKELLEKINDTIGEIKEEEETAKEVGREPLMEL